MRQLVIGATGWVGGRLVPHLLAHADRDRIRCLIRDPAKAADRPWTGAVEMVAGDALDPAALRVACTDVDVVHLLSRATPRTGWARSTTAAGAADRAVAVRVAQAARLAGVGRIVHLAAPGEAEVAEILVRSGVPTVVVRAEVLLGAGSATGEALRALAGRRIALPGWAGRPIRPVALDDVLVELATAAAAPPTGTAATPPTDTAAGPAHDETTGLRLLRGPRTCTVVELIGEAAVGRGRRPRRIPLLRVPRHRSGGLLAGWALAGLTPLSPAAARRTVVELTGDPDGSGPDAVEVDTPTLPGMADAVDPSGATRWSDATVGPAPTPDLPTVLAAHRGRVYTDQRDALAPAEAADVWAVVTGIGGRHGWYSLPAGWWARGVLDLLAGGVGLHRGRRDPDRTTTGEALDWWRVERVDRTESGDPAGDERVLRLRAEMLLPGTAWLEFTVFPAGRGRSRYRQRAVFVPRGVAGHLYWFSVLPFHGIVFGQLTRNVLRAARARR